MKRAVEECVTPGTGLDPKLPVANDCFAAP